jgi:hypothetical protein
MSRNYAAPSIHRLGCGAQVAELSHDKEELASVSQGTRGQGLVSGGDGGDAASW